VILVDITVHGPVGEFVDQARLVPVTMMTRFVKGKGGQNASSEKIDSSPNLSVAVAANHTRFVLM
jgi:hypothetical protein